MKNLLSIFILLFVQITQAQTIIDSDIQQKVLKIHNRILSQKFLVEVINEQVIKPQAQVSKLHKDVQDISKDLASQLDSTLLLRSYLDSTLNRLYNLHESEYLYEDEYRRNLMLADFYMLLSYNDLMYEELFDYILNKRISQTQTELESLIASVEGKINRLDTVIEQNVKPISESVANIDTTLKEKLVKIDTTVENIAGILTYIPGIYLGGGVSFDELSINFPQFKYIPNGQLIEKLKLGLSFGGSYSYLPKYSEEFALTASAGLVYDKSFGFESGIYKVNNEGVSNYFEFFWINDNWIIGLSTGKERSFGISILHTLKVALKD